MGVRGIDISNHQNGMDVERVVRENAIGFAFILSNDGTFKNVYYAAQAAAAARGGATVVPYIYLRTNVDQTFATFRQQVPTPGPVIVDVEDGSGGVAECRRMHDLLHQAGYRTPLLYWPDWYRKKIGGPSLTGFPPLWTSWYPDNTSRGFDAGLAMLPAWVWNGYGGLPTRIVQFTSSGRLSGYGANLDLNYFPGSRAELITLLNASQENDMSAETEEKISDLHQAAVETFIHTGGADNGGVGFGRAIADIRADVRDIQAALATNYTANGEPIGKTTADIEAKVDALATAVSTRLGALEQRLEGLATGTGVSVPDLARAIADEQDRRARDGDHATGPTT